MELLFESRTNLTGFSGHIHFFQNKPKVCPEPVLRPDSAGDGNGVSIYGSVLKDGGKLKMWYYAMPRSMGTDADGCFVAYAESDDGIRWVKPDMKLVPDPSEPSNITNIGLHSATVFMDPNSPASHKFRATGHGRNYTNGNCHNLTQRGYYTLHSADGLHWELDTPTPRWLSSDVITGIYHPGRGIGITALKYTPRWMRMRRRSIHTAEFCNGQYSDAVTALYPDEFDDICAVTRGFHSCDYYGMGMMPAGQATVGFLWKYWHALPYTGQGPQHMALYGTSDIALVYQPERGGKWFHMPGRALFIDREALPWTTGWINSASNVIEVGDEQRLYFSGRTAPHGYGRDADWKITAEKAGVFKESGITYASWPKDRLFGFESMPEASLIIQLGKIESPVEVFLNYEIFRPDGFIHAELDGVGIEKLPLDQSLPLTGSKIRQKISWQTGSAIPPTPVAGLKLHMRFARIYAYEVRKAGDAGRN